VSAAEPPDSRPSSHPQVPPVTEAIRERARQSPNSWIYSVDGAYDADGVVPPYAVIGAWPVNEHGELGTFTANDNYRPSPAALHLDLPTEAVDAALQLAATGHGSDSDVLAALAEASIYLPVNAEGELVAYRQDDGAESVAIFTDPSKAPATAVQLLAADIYSLIGVLPKDTSVDINPFSQVTARFSSDELRGALPGRSADEARTSDDQADTHKTMP
jgi:SseB protein N-terminal domain